MEMTSTAPLSFLRTSAGPFIPDAIREFPGGRASLSFLGSRGETVDWTYAEVAQEMDRRARNLISSGLQKGDALAIVLPEPEEFVLTFLGAMAAGLVPVPLYPPLGLGQIDAYLETCRRILRSSKSVAIVTDSRTSHLLWSCVEKGSTVQRVIDVADLHQKEVDETISLPALQMDAPAFLQYTSGSTSAPKGVVVTHRSLLANISAIAHEGLQLDRDKDHAVSWLPLYHDMGLIGFLLTPIWFGVSTTYMSPITFLKRPRIWLETISTQKATISFAPNFAYALAVKRTSPEQVAALGLSHVKALGCGAEPNHPATLQAFVDHFAAAGLRPEALLPCYGMAEATLAISFTSLAEPIHVDTVDADLYQDNQVAWPQHGQNEANMGRVEFVSCGRPFSGHEVVILDQEGNELPERHVGEIVFRGASITGGYFDDPEKTAAAFTPKGLRTGDLGYLFEGNLYVTGRSKDLIIIRGKNYDPQTLEWAAQEVPGVRKGNVVAFSVPGEQTEQLVVVAETELLEQAEEIKEAIRKRIRTEVRLEVAEVVLIGRGALPKTSSGKVQRQRTRTQYLGKTLGEGSVRASGELVSRRRLLQVVALSTYRRASVSIQSMLAKVLSVAVKV